MQTIRRKTPLRIGRLLVVLVGVPAVLGLSAPVWAEELNRAPLSENGAELKSKYATELEQLAAWCDRQGLTQQAQESRNCLGPRDPHKLYLAVLPQRVGRAELAADAPPGVVEWDTRLMRLQRDQANALFDLARRAVRGHRVGLAYELALAAIHANPDHEPVRRILGYQKYRGQWHTFYEVRKLRAGQVWHEKFGWLPKSHVRRYQQGQRPADSRWITAEEDRQRHQEIRSGWAVDTEHYSIITNHSLETGVQLGVKLERLSRIWRQLFIRYYASEAHVVALFDGRARTRQARMPKFNVAFFRDREDYNRSLKPAMPKIEISIGVYVEQARRAYFFAGKDSDDRTLYHEATHQLFHQSRPVAPDVGRKANFWIVEGIAMYMESLREENGYYVLGGFDDVRMQAARYRLLEDDFYVPLEELTTYGMEKLQKHPRVATLYSQAAGLTNFLVYYDGGRYRDALVAYLSAVYNGRDTPDTLAQLTGTSYTELDRQYRRFMEASRKPATGRGAATSDAPHQQNEPQ